MQHVLGRMSKRAVTLTSPPLVIVLHVSNVPHFLFSFLLLFLLLRHLLLQTTTAAATPRYWFFSLPFVRIHPRKKGSDPTTLPAECHFGANNFAAAAVIFPMDANFPKHLPSFHLKKRRALTKVAGVTQLGVGLQVNYTYGEDLREALCLLSSRMSGYHHRHQRALALLPVQVATAALFSSSSSSADLN